MVITWTEPAEPPDKVTDRRELPRLFAGELSGPQCTHHLLVSPQLEVPRDRNEICGRRFDRRHAYSGSIDAHISIAEVETQHLIAATNVPSEIRSFISRWQLATLQGWQKRTLIDPVRSETPIVVHVTRMRRITAVAVGTALLLVALCIILQTTVLEYRLGISLTAVTLLGFHFLMTVSVAEAILAGMFWGLVIGLTIVTLMQWRWLRTLSRQTFVRTASAAAAVFITILPCCGQQTDGKQGNELRVSTTNVRQRSDMLPDVLLPETQLPDNDVAYVRKSVLEKWQKKNRR